MLVKDLLELTQTKSIADIARDHLEIGKESARNALKKAGCYTMPGKRGWYYEGDPEILEKSIYDFHEGSKQPTKEKVIERNQEQKNVRTITPTNEQTIIRKRFSVDLDINLIKDLKLKSVMTDKNIYVIVETALKEYLKK